MKTEIFSFNELNVDGNGDYVQIVMLPDLISIMHPYQITSEL